MADLDDLFRSHDPVQRKPLRLLKFLTALNVFIKCRKCGAQNCMDEIRPRRVDLAMFRGSEDPVKCKECQADMDTMTAYCGEWIGSQIVRREDPKS
jgi:hypothetical protein